MPPVGVSRAVTSTASDLHEHPELSHQEFETARKVADRLRGCGFEVHDGIGGTAVIGVLDNGSGPRVLVRADMDALPVEEATGGLRQHRPGNRRRWQ
jgi:metal-dependent amidase/aminoacylase/carboxypeptidase family protein